MFATENTMSLRDFLYTSGICDDLRCSDQDNSDKAASAWWITSSQYSLLRHVSSLSPKDPRSVLVQEMKNFVSSFKTSYLDAFWHRKSKKVVLAILLIERDNEKGIYHFFRGMNTEVSLPSGSNCAERAAITSAATKYPDLKRHEMKAVAVADPNNELNPIDPCGVCDEWLKKVQEVNPQFSILTFPSDAIDVFIEKCPAQFATHSASPQIPKALKNSWTCRMCRVAIQHPDTAVCINCDCFRFNLKLDALIPILKQFLLSQSQTFSPSNKNQFSATRTNGFIGNTQAFSQPGSISNTLNHTPTYQHHVHIKECDHHAKSAASNSRLSHSAFISPVPPQLYLESLQTSSITNNNAKSVSILPQTLLNSAEIMLSTAIAASKQPATPCSTTAPTPLPTELRKQFVSNQIAYGDIEGNENIIRSLISIHAIERVAELDNVLEQPTSIKLSSNVNKKKSYVPSTDVFELTMLGVNILVAAERLLKQRNEAELKKQQRRHLQHDEVEEKHLQVPEEEDKQVVNSIAGKEGTAKNENIKKKNKKNKIKRENESLTNNNLVGNKNIENDLSTQVHIEDGDNIESNLEPKQTVSTQFQSGNSKKKRKRQQKKRNISEYVAEANNDSREAIELPSDKCNMSHKISLPSEKLNTKAKHNQKQSTASPSFTNETFVTVVEKTETTTKTSAKIDDSHKNDIKKNLNNKQKNKRAISHDKASVSTTATQNMMSVEAVVGEQPDEKEGGLGRKRRLEKKRLAKQNAWRRGIQQSGKERVNEM